MLICQYQYTIFIISILSSLSVYLPRVVAAIALTELSSISDLHRKTKPGMSLREMIGSVEDMALAWYILVRLENYTKY